jgi:carboxyl-terminal processing protease
MNILKSNKYMGKRGMIWIIMILLSFRFFCSCEINPPENKLTNEELLDYMKGWYLWYDTMPNVSAKDFTTLQDLLDTLVFDPPDRWSYIQETGEYNNYNTKGIYTGHGIGLRWNSEEKLKVAFIFDDSDLYTSGVTRGWEVTQINGLSIPSGTVIDTSLLGPDEEGIQNTFTFKTSNGSTQTITSTKKFININAVLHSEIIEIAGKKVGYLVLQNFTEVARDEITIAFSDFYAEDIDDLIIDLRYNPGGILQIASYLGNLIAGETANKGAFVKYVYNDKKSDNNHALRFKPEDYSLILTRIFFITTSSTASASEVLINALEPYIEDVYIIGGVTEGKPVGMIAKQYNDYTLVPVTFYMNNSSNEGGFFDGLQPDKYVTDDLDEVFGSPEEDCLKEILYFIENGSFSGGMKTTPSQSKTVRRSGFSTGAI